MRTKDWEIWYNPYDYTDVYNPKEIVYVNVVDEEDYTPVFVKQYDNFEVSIVQRHSQDGSTTNPTKYDTDLRYRFYVRFYETHPMFNIYHKSLWQLPDGLYFGPLQTIFKDSFLQFIQSIDLKN